jgi:hypothetical protein
MKIVSLQFNQIQMPLKVLTWQHSLKTFKTTQIKTYSNSHSFIISSCHYQTRILVLISYWVDQSLQLAIRILISVICPVKADKTTKQLFLILISLHTLCTTTLSSLLYQEVQVRCLNYDHKVRQNRICTRSDWARYKTLNKGRQSRDQLRLQWLILSSREK